eukprot:CAMPEP_0202882496 /NCGR_PEP_ID=MMETSP1391-20130828/38079_1 /ASSEMBLY_ACC=CAM_ASM_000867 /TAXON_ID=1034604 /ORGANISM="Chlamydomonas leiostraca, Strain SAG 11-49" /LENGTH=133 /DNA_ID=CAMNT_0049565363 /DNA_START=161 /DNA_END=562 /DNA_ORIENTATION=-
MVGHNCYRFLDIHPSELVCQAAGGGGLLTPALDPPPPAAILPDAVLRDAVPTVLTDADCVVPAEYADALGAWWLVLADVVDGCRGSPVVMRALRRTTSLSFSRMLVASLATSGCGLFRMGRTAKPICVVTRMS